MPSGNADRMLAPGDIPASTKLGLGVMICIPSRGLRRTEFCQALRSLGAPINTNTIPYEPIGLLVDEARNVAAKMAIDQGCKYILFIDEDVLIAPHTMRRLMYWLEQYDNLDAVGGVYCAKDPQDPDSKAYPLVFVGDGEGPNWDWRIGEFFEVTGLGLGATMIRTSTLAKMEPPWFMTQAYADRIKDSKGNVKAYHYFQGTEDLYFFRRLREELKGRVFCDASLVFNHISNDGHMWGLPPDSKPLRPITLNGKPFHNHGKIVLNLGVGGGTDIFEEGTALRIDIRPEAKPDLRYDIRNLPFDDDYADLVFSSHTLEHFGRWEVEGVLKEWVRVLKPGGEIRLMLPNLMWAAKKLVDQDLSGPDAGDIINVLYGGQQYDENYHQIGFTPKYISDMLVSYGCSKPRETYMGFNMIMSARKRSRVVDPVQDKMLQNVGQWIHVDPGKQVLDPSQIKPVGSKLPEKTKRGQAVQGRRAAQRRGSNRPEQGRRRAAKSRRRTT